MGLDLEPDAKPRFRRPDRRHLRAGVAGNHVEPITGSFATLDVTPQSSSFSIERK
jgi:hypothetical protein